jgi:hypothetical protein
MVMKDAFAILRADKQLQSSIHDFALCFQAREFFRLADQGFVNIDVSASHRLIIHHFYRDWCIRAEELITLATASEDLQIDPYFGGAVFSASENGALLFMGVDGDKPVRTKLLFD